MEINGKKYASIQRRILSFLIDVVHIHITSYIFYLLLPNEIKFPIYGVLFASIYSTIYFTIITYYAEGRTIGGRLLKLKIISVNGNHIKFPRALLRSIALAIIAIPYGFNWIIGLTLLIPSLINLAKKPKNRQAYWDVVSKTYVIRDS